MKTRIAAGLATTTLLFVAIAGVGGVQQPVGQAKEVANVVAGNDVFAFDLYSHLARKDGNLFFSPYSISTALAMTYGGARGVTAEAMVKTLHFVLPQEELHPAFGKLMRQFNGDSKDRKYQLFVANRLWGQKGLSFQPGFLNLTRDHYDAGLEEVDFIGDDGRAAARKTINGWVEKQTRDKIKELIPDGILNERTRLVLTNAIYFKAAWANLFPAAGTLKEKFHLNGQDTVTVPFMHKTEDCLYLANDTLQAVSIPYQDRQLNLIVLLPRKVDGLPAVEKQLTSARLNEWRGKMTSRPVNLMVPKFKFTSSFQLKKVLKEMGMGAAFEGADFSGMTTQVKLEITEVVHQAFVEVNEKGTEAAAATAVIMGFRSDTIAPPSVPFRADRPFVFLIQEAHTGSILFVGRVANPQAP